MRKGRRAKGSDWKVTVNTDSDTRKRKRENQMAKIRHSKRIAVLEHLETSTKRHGRKQLKGFSSLVDGVLSQDNDNNLLLKATIQICELLSTEQNPYIDGDRLLKLVSRFVQFLKMDNFQELQCEAAWALANIAFKTSEGTKVVIDERAMSVFVKLLYSPNPDVREQVVFAFGVVAGHSTPFRDCVLRHGILERMLEVLDANPNSSMLRNASWTLSNICGGIPPPSFEQVRRALEAMKSLLCSDDWEVLSDSCLALSSLSNGGFHQIEEVIRAGVCPALVKLLLHSSSPVVISALQAISNIVSDQDRLTKVILDLGALEYLLSLLIDEDNNQFITNEACFVISHITAGQMNQKQAVINAGLIEALVKQLKSADVGTCVNAAQAISNAASGGSHDQIKYLVSKGCIEALSNLVVHSSDSTILYTCLSGLVNILKWGGYNVYDELVRDSVGYERIMELARNKFERISRKALNLLFIP